MIPLQLVCSLGILLLLLLLPVLLDPLPSGCYIPGSVGANNPMPGLAWLIGAIVLHELESCHGW